VIGSITRFVVLLTVHSSVFISLYVNGIVYRMFQSRFTKITPSLSQYVDLQRPRISGLLVIYIDRDIL